MCRSRSTQAPESVSAVDLEGSYSYKKNARTDDVGIFATNTKRPCSGKSSLVLTILRLLEVRSGSIKIDSEDILTMPRQQIRSRLTALPQDPLKFSGTIRYNLDPEGSVQADEPLIEALKKAAVWSVVEARGGLDGDMDEAGLSAGQLQLFCLARALLSRSSIVLLDEATSSVDHQTDEEMRRVINRELVGRTVVEVAHRLEVVRECDVAVVMGEGRVLEVGPPEELLRTERSAFRALWESQHL
jgi:ATP-binding cassette subfamily C (CFTR/MRP) protein 1